MGRGRASGMRTHVVTDHGAAGLTATIDSTLGSRCA